LPAYRGLLGTQHFLRGHRDFERTRGTQLLPYDELFLNDPALSSTHRTSQRLKKLVCLSYTIKFTQLYALKTTGQIFYSFSWFSLIPRYSGRWTLIHSTTSPMIRVAPSALLRGALSIIKINAYWGYPYHGR